MLRIVAIVAVLMAAFVVWTMADNRNRVIDNLKDIDHANDTCPATLDWRDRLYCIPD